jgi:predicted Zn-dependent protease
MRKGVLLLFVLMLLVFMNPLIIFPQAEGKARLKGVVKDPDGKTIADVAVKLYSHRAGAGLETKTDKKGAWKAMWIRGGKWDLDFERNGFEPKKISTSLKEDGKVVLIETTLKPIKGPVIKKSLMKDFEKANVLYSKGKIDDALKIYEKIVTEFPDSYIIYLSVGNCYFDKQQYEQAIAAYLKVLAKEPDHTDTLITIGNCYSNMNQVQKALEWYKKIEVSKIDDPIVLYNIGVFNFNAGKIKEALAFFKRSVQVKADFVDGWYQLGMTYMSAGQNDEAVKAFETCLTHDSESEKAAQVKEILKALKQS